MDSGTTNCLFRDVHVTRDLGFSTDPKNPPCSFVLGALSDPTSIDTMLYGFFFRTIRNRVTLRTGTTVRSRQVVSWNGSHRLTTPPQRKGRPWDGPTGRLCPTMCRQLKSPVRPRLRWFVSLERLSERLGQTCGYFKIFSIVHITPNYY